MKNIFTAELYRNTHNLTFKICCILSFVVSGLFAYTIYHNAELSEEWFLAQCLLIATLVSLSVGDEMSNCVRKKAIAGYSKIKIFLVEMIISNLIVILQFMVTVLLCVIVNFRLLPHIPLYLAFITLVGFLSIALAFTSIFTATTCLVSKKALSAVLCLIFVVALYVVAPIVTNSLDEPQYIDTMEWNNEKSVMEPCRIENEKYIAGPARSVMIILNKANPFAQRIEYDSIIAPFLYDDKSWEMAKDATKNTMGEEYLSRELTEQDKAYLNAAFLYALVPAVLFSVVCGVLYNKKEMH